jgi:hypothetical protein
MEPVTEQAKVDSIQANIQSDAREEPSRATVVIPP